MRTGAKALRLVVSAAAVLALSGAAPTARAAEPTPAQVEQARTFFNAGVAAYANAAYADAAHSFEQAYALAPRPQLLFSLAQAERKQYFASNDPRYLKRAIDHYRAYLDEVKSGGRRSEATEAKADLEARLSRLDPQQQTIVMREDRRKPRVTVYSATPGATVSVDGGPPQEVPYFADLEPGKHTFKVSAEGFFDETREASGDKPGDIPFDVPLRERPAKVTVAYGGRGEVYVNGRVVATTPIAGAIDVPAGPHVLSLAVNGRKAWSQEMTLPRGKPVRVEPSPEISTQRVVAWSLLGVGAAGVASGLVFGGLSLRQEGRAQDVLEARAVGNISEGDRQAYNDAIDRRDAFRTVSIVSLSVGGALATGGTLLFVFDKPSVAVVPPRATEPAPAPRPQPTLDVAAYPVLGPGVAGAGLSGRF